MIPHLEDETNLEEAEKRLAEFGSNTKLGQNSALDLLDELGLAEGTRNRDQGLPKDAKEQGGPPKTKRPPQKVKHRLIQERKHLVRVFQQLPQPVDHSHEAFVQFFSTGVVFELINWSQQKTSCKRSI